MSNNLSNYKSQILVGVIAFGGGLGLGYFLGKRNREPTYQVIPAVQKDERSEPEVPVVSSDDNSEKVHEFIQEIIDGKHPGVQFHKETDEEAAAAEAEEVEGVAVNIFTNEDSDWDYEEELKKRNPREPYVLHQDEFYANEKDYHQITLTYYSGDNILVDEDNTPIYNHDAIVGPMLFGHGSHDKNTFHVRNDARKAEYEIVFDPGAYSIEVLGLEIEPNERVKGLKHSGVPKFHRDE